MPKTPLHDGAVVISGSIVQAAKCILPLSSNPGIDSHLGTRHRAALERAYGELARSRVGLADRLPLDLLAQGLREGLQALDDLEGRTTAEDLLDRIFARFCLGK